MPTKDQVMIGYKSRVIERYPEAYASRSADGYWWIWLPHVRAALNDCRPCAYSARTAWRLAYQEMLHREGQEP